jgi:hypothetical protein
MKKFIVAICAMILLSTASFAQTRKRQTTKHPSTSKSTSASTAKLRRRYELKAPTGRDADQEPVEISLFGGGVVKGIEAIDAQSKDGQTSPTNEKNKAQLRASFTDFRVGLDSLEVYFRTTPELQPYYTKLVGSASGAASAEQQALAGQFDHASKSLLDVLGA